MVQWRGTPHRQARILFRRSWTRCIPRLKSLPLRAYRISSASRDGDQIASASVGALFLRSAGYVGFSPVLSHLVFRGQTTGGGVLPRAPSFNWLPEVYALLDAFSQPIKQVRPPLCLPRCIHRYIPSVIHCAPSHYSFLPPYLPNSRLCAGGANVPFLERHDSDPPRLARLGRAQKQDRPGPLCGTPRSAGGFASADLQSVLLHALQESDSQSVRIGEDSRPSSTVRLPVSRPRA